MLPQFIKTLFLWLPELSLFRDCQRNSSIFTCLSPPHSHHRASCKDWQQNKASLTRGVALCLGSLGSLPSPDINRIDRPAACGRPAKWDYFRRYFLTLYALPLIFSSNIEEWYIPSVLRFQFFVIRTSILCSTSPFRSRYSCWTSKFYFLNMFGLLVDLYSSIYLW